jgi:hypothetical protein
MTQPIAKEILIRTKPETTRTPSALPSVDGPLAAEQSLATIDKTAQGSQNCNLTGVRSQRRNESKEKQKNARKADLCCEA